MREDKEQKKVDEREGVIQRAINDYEKKKAAYNAIK